VNPLPGRLVLIGHPVSHSHSPAFQNAALRRAGLPLTYEALDVPPGQLERTATSLRAEGAAGNVTVPYKQAFVACCARLSPIAERVGAVNTFWSEEGTLVGDNTDVGGFEEAIVRAFGAERRWPRIALIGAGGAAAAVLAAAERWFGTEVRIWSRTPGRASALALRFAGVSTPMVTLHDVLEGADLVVNASPLGLSPRDALPALIQDLPPRAAVFDLVYRRGETAWVLAARGAGHPAADGMGMLVAQGALAFERWFGQAPDRDVMWSALRS
jgi:shikimate dehydrogenase